MAFVDDLQRWVIAELSRRGWTGRNIRRLLEGFEGGSLTPIQRQALLLELIERIPARAEPEGIAETPPGSWIYYPVSDDAPQSWGDPYSTQLGTPQAGSQCSVGLRHTIDRTGHPYRLYDGDSDVVTHGTPLTAGRFYWRYDDYTITWGPPMGEESKAEQFSDNTFRWIYRNGSRLASTRRSAFDNPNEIRAAAIRKIGATNYLYIISNGQGTGTYDVRLLLMRAPIDPYGQDQEPTWEWSFIGVPDALNTLDPPFVTSPPYSCDTPLLPCSFNKSCTHVLLCHPGRVVELDITTWGSESIVSDTYWGDSLNVVLPGPGGFVLPVLSTYESNSDTRKDLTIEVVNSGDPIPTDLPQAYNAVVTATLKEDSAEIDSFTLYNAVPSWTERKAAFLTVNPYYQDVQGGVYCIDFHQAYNLPEGMPLETRHHTFRVYSGGQIAAETTVEELFPGDLPIGTGHWDEFTHSGAISLRDVSTYPQYNFASANLAWLWFLSENVMTWLASELACFVMSKPSTGTHIVDSTKMLLTSNEVVSPEAKNFDNHQQFAFASDWNGSFVLSRRIFDGWGTAYPEPDYRWWNVGTVDLMQKTGVIGNNQRLLTYGCQGEQGFVKNDWNHIGVYYVSSATPF